MHAEWHTMGSLVQFLFIRGPKCKRGVWQEHVKSEETTPNWFCKTNYIRTCSESLSISLFFHKKKDKKKNKTWWKWWIVSSVFPVLLSHQSHFVFFLAPSWQNPNGPNQSVSQSLVPCQHSMSIDSTCVAATQQIIGAERRLWHMIHQKYSHTNYYFVICHLDLLRCWPIVKQLMYLSSLSKFILTRPWAAPTKTHYFGWWLNPRCCKPECGPK